MSLRDYFAAHIVQGLCANPDRSQNTIEADAKDAYRIADAMMRARAQNNPLVGP